MGKYFSDKVEEGIRLVWFQQNKETIDKGFRLLEEAAKEGDADGMCFLACCFMGRKYLLEEIRLPEDEEKAVRYFKESVLRGSAVGVLCALRCDALTPYIRRNMPLTLAGARDIVLEKAEAGEPFCQYLIGDMYFTGDVFIIDDVDVDKAYPEDGSYYAFVCPKATEWLERALKGGMCIAYDNLYGIYTYEKGGFPADPERLFAWAEYGAERGCPSLMNEYAIALNEKGKEQESFYWCKKAADAGSPTACYNMGERHEFGKEVEQDKQKAFDYYMKSVRGGNGNACFKVGYFYYAGIGLEADDAKAAYWLEKGCKAGSYRCYPPLAICYQYGSGVQQDVNYAFELASEGEKYTDDYPTELNSLLWHALGRAYGFGMGTQEDIPRGIRYFQKALEAGDQTARENLACFRKNLFGKWERIR